MVVSIPLLHAAKNKARATGEINCHFCPALLTLIKGLFSNVLFPLRCPASWIPDLRSRSGQVTGAPMFGTRLGATYNLFVSAYRFGGETTHSAKVKVSRGFIKIIKSL